jgi:hypothetical protein
LVGPLPPSGARFKILYPVGLNPKSSSQAGGGHEYSYTWDCGTFHFEVVDTSLKVNDRDYGLLKSGDEVVIDGRDEPTVSVNGMERAPAETPARPGAMLEGIGVRRNMRKAPNQPLKWRIEQGIAIVTFTDPTLHADAVNEAHAIITAADTRKAVLDCQSVRSLLSGSLFPDAEPLTPLLRLRRYLTEKGGRLVLCNLDTEIAEVLRITRLNKLFEIQPDVTKAVTSMKE